MSFRPVDFHAHPRGVRAPAHELGVVVGARRVTAGREVDRLEDVGLARAVHAGECGHPASEHECHLAVGAEVLERQVADAHQAGMRSGITTWR